MRSTAFRRRLTVLWRPPWRRARRRIEIERDRQCRPRRMRNAPGHHFGRACHTADTGRLHRKTAFCIHGLAPYIHSAAMTGPLPVILEISTALPDLSRGERCAALPRDPARSSKPSACFCEWCVRKLGDGTQTRSETDVRDGPESTPRARGIEAARALSAAAATPSGTRAHGTSTRPHPEGRRGQRPARLPASRGRTWLFGQKGS